MTRKKPLKFDTELSTRDHQYKLHHLQKNQRHVYHVGCFGTVPGPLVSTIRHLVKTNQVEPSQRKVAHDTYEYIARGKQDRNPEYRHGKRVIEI